MRAEASPEKIKEVLEAVYALWLDKPHQRLGQLLLNLCYIRGVAENNTVNKLWNMDEDEVLLAIRNWNDRDA